MGMRVREASIINGEISYMKKMPGSIASFAFAIDPVIMAEVTVTAPETEIETTKVKLEAIKKANKSIRILDDEATAVPRVIYGPFVTSPCRPPAEQ